MLVWLISSSRSFCNTSPPSNTHTLTTHTLESVKFISLALYLYVIFFHKLSSFCFFLNFKRSRGGLPDTGPGGGQEVGMNRNNGYVVTNRIEFIFNAYSEFDCE